MSEKVCAWVEDSDGSWHTQCDNYFIVTEGKPDENGMKFCCYCGGEIAQMDYSEQEDGEE